MSSCFPLSFKFKIPKILTSLSAIGTFFCFKKGGYEQSSTSQQSSTNFSNNSPRNNSNEGVINSSELSGANTQNGGESDSNSPSSSLMISISRESSDCYTLSRTLLTGSFEPLTGFTPPVDNSSLRIVMGMSRSDARQDANKPRFIAAPEFRLKFTIGTSGNNEGLKGKAFIKDYIDRIINDMKSSNPTKEDQPSQQLSGSKTLDLPAKIMQGRDTRGYRGLPNPEDPNKNQTNPVKNGVRRKSALTLVPPTKEEMASQIVIKARMEAEKNKGKPEMSF